LQRLLVSVRGPVEAIEAANGGALIADVEFPASALGTPYPLNIDAVRRRLRQHRFRKVFVSTNIGEDQAVRATACQAALGVASAGADLIKCGLAKLSPEEATYLGDSIVRTVRFWHPSKKVYPAVFIDDELRRTFDPFDHGPTLAAAIKANGVLIDTYDKGIGRGLLDYCSAGELAKWVAVMHKQRREAWIAGSITLEQLPQLWRTGVDVICVRGAAVEALRAGDRFGEVRKRLVKELVSTIPR
jgi:uncharacterized protein (UPF0264 family)